jgi:L-cysteine S-thiosulfotransferase
MQRIAIIAVALLPLAPPAKADEGIAPGAVEAAVAGMFRNAGPEWQSRVVQDETQKVCSQFRNNPPAAEAEKIVAREKASLVLPADGNVLGDWKKGEAIAEMGSGGQFSDDPTKPNGGNCYACHQMAAAEVAFGTLGPSLQGYGRTRNFTPEAARAAYAKIYNSQSVVACSNMPRFGHNRFLTAEQIQDVTAYLMSPDSPVNK